MLDDNSLDKVKEINALYVALYRTLALVEVLLFGDEKAGPAIQWWTDADKLEKKMATP